MNNEMEAYNKLIQVLDEAIEPLTGEKDQYDNLLNRIGDARFVLLGEASHGTHEFYQSRIEISRQLILKKGFMAIAIEGDWPDVYPIHRFIKGTGADKPEEALEKFKRFPQWMWRNTTIPPFISWLREHNETLSDASQKIGFYGMDLYSLNASIEAVISYLKKVDPDAAEKAKIRYGCFDSLGVDPQTYGYLTKLGIKKNCIKEALDQLLEMQHKSFDYLKENSITDEDAYFYATQNARLVKNAERYYRSMFEGTDPSWNIRDTHMADTINILAEHLEKRFEHPAKIIIWAHNSHLGDARATEMSERGELNLGQLMREQHGREVFSIGFSTYEGHMAAASNWDEAVECKAVVPGMEGSYEALFHDLSQNNFILPLRQDETLEHWLQLPRLQRAIGVIYRPESERYSHYFFTRLTYQFDNVIHFDKTNALQPLDVSKNWNVSSQQPEEMER